MPVFNREKLNQGAWFDYEDGRIKIKSVSSSDTERIRKETAEEIVEYKNIGHKRAKQYQRIESVKVDSEKARYLLWDAVIESWENFFWDDEKTDLIECNFENKKYLMLNDPKLETFINKCVDIQAEDDEIISKDLEKNSGRGSSVNSKNQPAENVKSSTNENQIV
jgi:hypothetical protein